MAKAKSTTIYNIKADTSADKSCALIDTAKSTLLRLGDYVKVASNDSVKRNYGILGLAIDGIADEMREMKCALNERNEKLKAYEAEIAALKEANPDRMERVLKSANSIVDKIAANVADKVSKHLVRSKTESEATEMTKGYDLFAEAAEPTKFEAYLDDDRILSVEIVPCSIMRNSKTKPGTIRALAERVRIVDYVGNEIETIYEKEAK